MKYSKYNINDFLNIKKGLATIDEVAKKYGVSIHSIHCVMSRLGIHRNATAVKLTTPYKEQICYSIHECARVVGVSVNTIRNALKGKQSKILKELEVKVEEYKIDYGEEEYDY